MRNLNDLIEDFKNDNMSVGSIFASENENGENVIIQVFKDYLQVKTCQDNGWLRINCYYKDGTITEDYEK